MWFLRSMFETALILAIGAFGGHLIGVFLFAGDSFPVAGMLGTLVGHKLASDHEAYSTLSRI